MLEPKEEPQRRRCAAIEWSTGKWCQWDYAVDGSPYCRRHLALIPPDEWILNGYASILPSAQHPLFRAASSGDLSEEISLARLHLMAVASQHGLNNPAVLAALHAVAKLVKMRQDIEGSQHERRMKR